MTHRFFILTAALLLVGGGALAHHGWGSYDAAKPFSIRGEVRDAALAEPARPSQREASGRDLGGGARAALPHGRRVGLSPR